MPERVVKRVITRVITRVDAEDGDAAEALLRASGLPLAGLEDTALWGLERRGQLVAVGGFERYGDLALLRSLAVRPEERGKGCGGALLRHLLKTLQADGVTAAYGLTTTIPEWLRRLGFREVLRDELPAALSSSEQLRGACPASAKVFAKDLL